MLVISNSVITTLRDFKQPYVVFGHTSNLLFSDAGLTTIGVQISGCLADIDISDHAVTCGAGAWVPMVAKACAAAGLQGIEHVCGIPGTIGGLTVMNGGSMRRCIGDHIDRVTSVDRYGQVVERESNDCDFGYRRSIFQSTQETIVRVKLVMERGSPKKIRQTMLEIFRARRQKFPHRLPNCGSVFISNRERFNELGPPGQIVEALGFKGVKIGGAQVSPLHGNFINNVGGAKSSDVLALIAEIRSKARAEFGVELETEARFVTPDGRVVPLDRAIAERYS